MKKVMYILLLATLVLFTVPLPSYAGHSGAYAGANFTVGHAAWRGYHGGYHGGWYGHYYPWGPRFYWGGSIFLGAPWYPYGYYASPPVVVQPPPVYTEPEQSQQTQQNYWYYCQKPQGYYPYVQRCPGGWMKVVPESAPPK